MILERMLSNGQWIKEDESKHHFISLCVKYNEKKSFTIESVLQDLLDGKTLDYGSDWNQQIRRASAPAVQPEPKKIPLSGQLWESCECCGGEGPIYMSHGCCEDCVKEGV